MKVAIISHTEHYTSSSGEIVGWGPTIKEINYLSDHVDSITHIAPLHEEQAPKSSIGYASPNITFVSLKPSGGKSLDKLSLLWYAPKNLIKIHKAIQDADIIQFRAPTGIGMYVLPFLKFLNRRKYWVKYAGNWKDPHMPMGNRFQKWWLRKMLSLKTAVTVNGKWEGERSNVIPFENPCLDEDNRIEGAKIIEVKKSKPEQYNFCFIGALNRHKGVDKIIEALSSVEDSRIGEIHFVGDGEEKNTFIESSKGLSMNVHFHGFLKKDQIIPILTKSHFLMLPSKSEGFPKVIGESMNYGCIPIVSDVSCISQYIVDGKNGFLINPLTSNELKGKILQSVQISHKEFVEILELNYNLAQKFTYSYYVNQLKKLVFDN